MPAATRTLPQDAPTGTPGRGRVLVGYDGSAPADRALDLAVREAERRRTGLEILCGLPWGRPLVPECALDGGSAEALHATARATLDRAARHVRETAPGTEAVTTLTAEPVVPALVHAGRTAVLTVLGTRGHGGFSGLLLGSVTLRVAAHTVSPLLVVRGDAGEQHGTVLVGYSSDNDAAALRYGFEEARRRGAVLKVVHAWHFPGAADVNPARLRWEDVRLLEKSADAVPEFAVSLLRDEYADVSVTTAAVCLGAARALTGESAAADVVVVSAHRRRHGFGLQLGAVTHGLLHHARCPVLLVPAP
ncbi:universal stress protein [Streptomyces gamaensis]|uniref:Universal stress protein n=1 Tax=Streptomyces gamaensis TaxID=1763542 RepID=A0ABW0YZ77_9ACTN